MRTLAAVALVLSLPAAGQAPPAEKGRAVTRIAYWSTKPGKQTEARAFWKPIALVFKEMRQKGLLLEYQFLSPALHTGQSWDLAYIWVCKDMASYGAAVDYFDAALAQMDSKKIGADFETAFDGSTHRDELWRSETIE